MGISTTLRKSRGHRILSLRCRAGIVEVGVGIAEVVMGHLEIGGERSCGER